MKASIERIKLLDNPKNTLAFLDIKIEDTIIVRGFKLMNGKNGRWLACPSEKGKDKDGNEKYFPTVSFSSKEAYQGFQDHILKLAQPKESNNPGNAVRPEDIAWEE